MVKSATFNPMPSFARLLKKLHLAILLPITVLLLSGCSAVGTNKPSALQVTSTPEASVFLDGKHLGKTPFYSDQLQGKEYTVKLSAGEAAYTQKVKLTPGTLTVINRELNNNFMAQNGEVLWLEQGQKGLFIVSMPDEADIAVDGQLIGKTPKKIEEIADGEHKVQISKQGYVEKAFAVKTSKEYQLVADVTLASEIANGSVAEAVVPQLQMVEILATPQGFLRVRKEASTASPEIGRVKPQDKLELVQETKDWVMIKFEGKQGWVSAQYIKKLPAT